MNAEALRRLSAADPVMRRLIREYGPCTLVPEKRRPPFQSLVQAVAHQQLHGRAAETILHRFKQLFPGRRFPRPEDLASVSDAALRGAGFSRAKVAALRDIAAQTRAGVVPTARQIAGLSDEAIIARLTQVRGVGRWTVEMLLIFQLGRPDVLPADDFGVRNGFRLAYGLKGMPRPKALLKYAERWKPYRSAGAWYMWRAVDLHQAGQLPRREGRAPRIECEAPREKPVKKAKGKHAKAVKPPARKKRATKRTAGPAATRTRAAKKRPARKR